MGLSGDINYGLFTAAKQQAPVQKESSAKNNDVDAVQQWLKNRPKKQDTNEAKSQPVERFTLLSENKQSPKTRATIDPSAISAEEIEKAGGLKEYTQKAVSVELFKGNYDNATVLVSYLKEKAQSKAKKEEKPQQRGIQASSTTVSEKLKQDDYDGALSDIDKMKAMNDMFARAFATVQKQINEKD